MSAQATVLAQASKAAARSRARERWHTALHSGALIAGVSILGFWILCALCGARLAPLDPFADNLLATLAPPSAGSIALLTKRFQPSPRC